MNEYETILEGMRLGISKHLMDKHYTILWANSYAYDLAGYTKQDFYTRYHNRIDEYYRKDGGTFNYVTDVIESSYKKQKAGFALECSMKSNRGKRKWIYMEGHFSNEVYRGIPVIWTVFYDITDLYRGRKEIEEKSELLKIELKKTELMRQWTADLLSDLNRDILSLANVITGITDVAEIYFTDQKRCGRCLEIISETSRHLKRRIKDACKKFQQEAG